MFVTIVVQNDKETYRTMCRVTDSHVFADLLEQSRGNLPEGLRGSLREVRVVKGDSVTRDIGSNFPVVEVLSALPEAT